jgi:hypothetical protein
MMFANRERICLGLYACKGFNPPNKQRQAQRYATIEITDNATLRFSRGKVIAAVVSQMCPHPMKFRQVWHFARGAKSLYAWQPVAPDNFVALGMYITTSPDTPDVKVMRCVPSIWCAPSKSAPLKVWDDAGAGGGKPASMWVINALGMFTIVTGHEAPKDTFFELNSGRFFLDHTHNVVFSSTKPSGPA